MSLVVDQRPITFLGFSLEAWAFVGRTWLALVIALYVSFWLELGSPASAGLTVAVLAFPSRGQGLEKAGYRVLATVIGVVAAIAIIGTFSQTHWLLIAVLALWVGGCVYVSGLFDGFRSYAAVLCIITVCLIAVEQLDTPQNVFNAGMERGAAIIIGILSVSLVNDVLSAPNYYTTIAARLEALHLRIASLARGPLAGRALPMIDVASLLREITALRPEITSLAAESSIGATRSAAARTAMVNLVHQLAATRAVTALSATGGQVRETDADVGATQAPSAGTVGDGMLERALAWMTAERRRREGDVTANLAALRAGKAPRRPWRAPFYRSHRIAARNGVTACLYFALAGLAFDLGGWPATSVSLAFVGILVGLSAMSPDQTGASLLALVAVPIGCLLAGLLEFVVLDGVTAFPLLAIGLFPFVAIPALLMTSVVPAIVTFGRSNLVFAIAVFSPSNPQTYNPQTFLFTCTFLGLAALLLFIFQHLIPPLSGMGRARILLAEAKNELLRVADRRRHHLAREEALFQDAVRIGQMAVASGHSTASGPLLEQAIKYFDRGAALRLAHAAIETLPLSMPTELREMARAAVANVDGVAMLRAAEALASVGIPLSHPSDDPSAALAVAGFALGRESDAWEVRR